MKRLMVVFFVSILLLLGWRSLGVTPASASPIKLTNHSLLPAFTPVINQGYDYISQPVTTQEGVQKQPVGVFKKQRPSMKHAPMNISQPNPGSTDTLTNNRPKQSSLSVDGSLINLNAALNQNRSALLSENLLDNVSLQLYGPGHVNLTEPIYLYGTLTDSSNNTRIANKSIRFTTSGTYLGQTHTNDQGIFKVKINKDLSAGSYLITATFKGAHLLAPANGAAWVQVLPATIQIQTVPAIAGIAFQMDDQQFTSGQDGYASIDIDKAGVYRLEVLLDQYHDPSQKVEFGRWGEESYQPSREVSVPYDGVIQVGLDIYHKVSMQFVDLDGLPVDPSRITSISIRSIQGDVFTLKPGDTPWLPASRTARRQTGLEKTDLLYSLNSVKIDGSNVVNSAQQRFYAKPDDTWTISLLLYSLHITAKDGLFASPLGKSVDILLPNGQTQNYSMDKSGILEIHSLARGIYHISLVGVKGLGTSTPVALSRNQVVNLKIVTLLDVSVVGLLSFALALGLILYGRPKLIVSLLDKIRGSSIRFKWLPKHEN